MGLMDAGGAPNKILLDPAVQHGVRELLAWAVRFFRRRRGVGRRETTQGVAYVPPRLEYC